VSDLTKVAFLSMLGDSSIITAMGEQGFAADWYYCLNDEKRAFPGFGSDYVAIDLSKYSAAIIDCSELARGLDYKETIRLFTANGVPCVAMSASGHDEGMLESGAVKVVYRRALADMLFDRKLMLSDLRK
jgi:hypothetical protein